jgi:hypothetical protein
MLTFLLNKKEENKRFMLVPYRVARRCDACGGKDAAKPQIRLKTLQMKQTSAR